MTKPMPVRFISDEGELIRHKTMRMTKPKSVRFINDNGELIQNFGYDEANLLPFAGVSCKPNEKDCKVWWLATSRDGEMHEVELTIPDYLSFATSASHAEAFLEDALNSSMARINR